MSQWIPAEPVTVNLPGYPTTHTVTRVYRQRGQVTRQMLTLVDATWRYPSGFGGKEWSYLTMMRLADILHRQHGLPVNPRYYDQQTYLQGA
jgi:hypothetical protein